MKILISAFVIIFAFLASSGQAQNTVPSVPTFTYLTEEFKPYNYTEYGQAKGLGVELLKLMWQELDVPEHSIIFMPWARAYEMTRSKPGHVLFSMVKTPERSKLFKWVGPIALSRTLLIARSDSNISMSSFEDAFGHSICVVRDYASAITLNNYEDSITIDTLNSVDMCIRKLASDRIDLISMEERTFNRAIQKMRLKPEKFKIVWVLNETLSYYAFSKETPDVVISRFQRAFDAVRKTPEYEKLVNQYLK